MVLGTEQVDIRVLYPASESISQKPQGMTVAFGDMHSNTMKLLWLLAKDVVIKKPLLAMIRVV